MRHEISRREFMTRSALYGGSLVVALQLSHPRALRAAQASTAPLALSPEQWKTVEAITGCIIPKDDDPGAIEAGCVNFIDKALAHEASGLRGQYEVGLAGVDAVARRRFEKRFAELEAPQQDELLAALEDGRADGWPEGEVRSEQFFETVRVHTIQGFLADPRYGGNRDYVGWKLVSYPGPRHHAGGYTPQQMLGEARIEAIWDRKAKPPA